MKTVRFTIYRKKALSGLFLPNRVYVNGKLAGTIRFGGTLAVEVPKADLYHLTESVSPFDDSAALFDRGDREYRVLLKKVGGRWTRTRYRFHLRTGDRIDPLPAFRNCPPTNGCSRSAMRLNVCSRPTSWNCLRRNP